MEIVIAAVVAAVVAGGAVLLLRGRPSGQRGAQRAGRATAMAGPQMPAGPQSVEEARLLIEEADVELRERLSLEVRDILKQQNTTAILVTHDQHEAFNIADVVGIMARGTIEQWDTPYNLYHEPASRMVADFIGQGTFLPGTVVDGKRVELELGIFPAKLPAEWPRGAALDVLVRPDDILHDDSSPLQAEVLHKAFRGAAFLYTLRLPGGGRVMSLVPSHHNHAIGEKIGIRLEIDHLVAFLR